MNFKIIKKLLAYANEHEIFDFAITQKNGQPVLWGENGPVKYQIKLPAKLENELSTDFRQLLSLTPSDLVTNAYFKTKNSAFHLSIIPDNGSEKIIITNVSKTKKLLSLSHLGLGRDERHLIENFLNKRRGLIIVGADNNQGKTTTLYSLLQKINKNKRSCYSLEEYQELKLDKINQLISFKEKRLSDLNQILKSDSEVIMIDDATDNLLSESIAAAKTGRLILVGVKADKTSTLIEKIINQTGDEDLPILIIFQKLLMKNCPRCLQAYAIDESEKLINKYWPSKKTYKPKYFYSSQGCAKCQHSGVTGQIATFNLTELNKQKINIISTLASDVLQKASNGLISISKFINEHQSASIKKL